MWPPKISTVSPEAKPLPDKVTFVSGDPLARLRLRAGRPNLQREGSEITQRVSRSRSELVGLTHVAGWSGWIIPIVVVQDDDHTAGHIEARARTHHRRARERPGAAPVWQEVRTVDRAEYRDARGGIVSIEEQVQAIETVAAVRLRKDIVSIDMSNA
jgi:hypothetical protein